MAATLQTPFDAAVVMTTVVRPTIGQAIRSMFAQRFAGRIQVLIGIRSEAASLEQLGQPSGSLIPGATSSS